MYAQALPYGSELYLTVTQRQVAGDALFPPFERLFTLADSLAENPEFKILPYRNPRPLPWPGTKPAV